jgi:hypothetical protein
VQSESINTDIVFTHCRPTKEQRPVEGNVDEEPNVRPPNAPPEMIVTANNIQATGFFGNNVVVFLFTVSVLAMRMFAQCVPPPKQLPDAYFSTIHISTTMPPIDGAIADLKSREGEDYFDFTQVAQKIQRCAVHTDEEVQGPNIGKQAQNQPRRRNNKSSAPSKGTEVG